MLPVVEKILKPFLLLKFIVGADVSAKKAARAPQTWTKKKDALDG